MELAGVELGVVLGKERIEHIGVALTFFWIRDGANQIGR
jgi:hypothetical protein